MQVSLDPASDPDLDTFLRHVIGFDSVDDESKAERPMMAKGCVLAVSAMHVVFLAI